MKNLTLLAIVISAFIAGCGGGGSSDDDSSTSPDTSQSFSNFVRDIFSDDVNDQPREINDLTFNQDAETDDFADLF